MLARVGALWLLIGAVAAPGASGQVGATATAVDSGVLVRIHTTEGVIRGRLLQSYRHGDAAMRFCRYPAPPCTAEDDSVFRGEVLAGAIHGLEVQRGNRWAHGAAVGGVIGGLLGAMLDGLAAGFCDSSDCPAGGKYMFGGAFLVGGLGALWGATVPKWAAAPW